MQVYLTKHVFLRRSLLLICILMLVVSLFYSPLLVAAEKEDEIETGETADESPIDKKEEELTNNDEAADETNTPRSEAVQTKDQHEDKSGKDKEKEKDFKKSKSKGKNESEKESTSDEKKQKEDQDNSSDKKNQNKNTGLSLFADIKKSGDYDYKVNEDGNVTLLLYSGGETNITIPDEIEGKPVTEIAARAFTLSNQLGEVVIPNTVKKIGSSAFDDTGITSLTLPEGLIHIENNAFAKNQLTHVTLPESLQYLGGRAFAENALEAITVPGSVELIRGNTFAGNKLRSVTLENGIKEIDGHSFALNKIESLTIPESVEKIGLGAFSHNKIASLTLPDSDMKLDAQAFSHNKLTTVSIPPKIKSIEHEVFLENNLTEVYMHTTAFNPHSDMGNYFGDNQADPQNLTVYGYEQIRNYVERQGFTFVPFDKEIAIAKGPKVIKLSYDRPILIEDLKNELWNHPITVTLDNGEEVQVPIQQMSDGEPKYNDSTPGTYIFTANFNLEGLPYTNPDKLFVTFEVTTTFESKKKAKKHLTVSDPGLIEGGKGGPTITIEGKGGPGIQVEESDGLTTNQNKLPKTATPLYTLIVSGAILLFIGIFIYFITTRRKQKLSNTL